MLKIVTIFIIIKILPVIVNIIKFELCTFIFRIPLHRGDGVKP